MTQRGLFRASANSCAGVMTAALATALMLGLAAPSFAAGADDKAAITDNAFQNAQGRVGVNVSAGTFNQQTNSAVVAVGGSLGADGLAEGTNTVVQKLGANNVSGTGPQSASIDGNAFADSFGMIAVNSAAGSQNQQANLAAIVIGINAPAVSLNLLEQSRSSAEPDANPEAPADAHDKIANIGPNAFENAGGLVQVNVTAGERNSTANLFALSIAGGSNN
jgi:hypothetical protein